VPDWVKEIGRMFHSTSRARRHLFMLAATVLAAAAVAQDETPFVKDGELDLDAVVEHFEDLYRSSSSIAEAELIITKPRKTKNLELKLWTEGEEKALIVIQAPVREKGTATLKIDDNLWNYFPKINRTVRIPPSMMLSSWMGSDFTNDDLVRDSSYRDDYEYELAGESQSPPGWLIRFNAKPDIVGLWNRFDVVMSEDGMLPLKAEYFDRNDELARTITWSAVKEFDGRQIPAHMTLVPVDKEGHKTELIYSNIEFDVDLPRDTFSLSNLERKR
jgi:outer membrane lipoprotein-sorting protein